MSLTSIPSENNNSNHLAQVRIKRSRHDKENPFAQISKKMLRDKDLSLSAKGLLCYFLSLNDCWDIQPKQVAAFLGQTEHKIYKAIKELREAGYCERICHRNAKGRVEGWSYEVSEEKIYNYDPKSDFQPDCKIPDVDNPDLDKCHIKETESKKTQSKSDIYKDNVLRDGGNVDNSNPKPKPKKTMETMSSFKSNSKTLDASRRWNLSQDQQDTFNFLDGDHIDTDQNTKAFWAKKYSLERLIEVYEEAKSTKGVRSIAAYMQTLLKKGASVAKAHAVQNLEYAKYFKDKTGWQQLEIMKKYVKVPCGNGSIEIDFNMQPKDFQKTLMNKYANRN